MPRVGIIQDHPLLRKAYWMSCFQIADNWCEIFAKLEHAQPIARFCSTWFHSPVHLR
jgi:hypothetical protein